MRLLIDAHLDIAWNALSFNRDQTWPIEKIRASEAHMDDHKARGHNTVSLPELRRVGAAVCVATLLSRSGMEQAPQKTFVRTDLEFATQPIAHATAQGQLAYYKLLERQGEIRLIKNRRDLDEHWQTWRAAGPQSYEDLPVGFILSMEGADPIVEPEETQLWHDAGLRAIGPAHYGQSHYAGGTGCSTPLTPAGQRLLAQMQRLGMLLDVTHLCDQAMEEAFDVYDGPILASHHNCRTLVPNERQITDDQIKKIIARDAVIGAALDAWMLYPGWVRGQTSPEVVTLQAVADQTDHVCQLAGNTRHAAIGTDLDGGFGTEQTPGDLDTIYDIQKLDEILSRRGYSSKDLDAIFHGNWLRLFGVALPV